MCNLNPLGCWLSSAPVQLSLNFGFGVRVGTTVHLPNKRCRSCKGHVPTPPASTISTASASGEQAGGLAWELQKRIGEACSQPLVFVHRCSVANASVLAPAFLGIASCMLSIIHSHASQRKVSQPSRCAQRAMAMSEASCRGELSLSIQTSMHAGSSPRAAWRRRRHGAISCRRLEMWLRGVWISQLC